MAVIEEKLLMINELKKLEQEHQDLNIVVDNKTDKGDFDQLTAQRIKKRKLFIKDRISYIKSILYPDIIA